MEKTESAFRKIIVWQRAMELTSEVYVLVKKLPHDELFGLTSQVRRCAVSIPSNIAEGSKRGKKEFLQFLRVANGSAAELETQLLIVERVYAIKTPEKILGILNEVQRMLQSLLKSV